jgi:hypothetical protein
MTPRSTLINLKSEILVAEKRIIKESLTVVAEILELLPPPLPPQVILAANGFLVE